MSDDQTKALKDLFVGVSSPWDVAAIAAGAGAGAVVTVVTGGADLGASIAAGATLSLTAKKGAEAALAKRQLRKQLTTKSSNLLQLLRNPRPGGGAPHKDLAQRLEDEKELWEAQVTSDSEFDGELDEIVDAYRRERGRSRDDPPDNLLRLPGT